ncbi:MAG: tRNA pseudouridine(38-40) synthase TruA [Actinomycetota bacterium]|nr:tRNA pseudouridine(38-40) synthase TruA [Actinomycetota bacterium]
MPTYRLDISYDGSTFFGYGIQDNVRTVQGELEKALNPHTGGANTVVAGRTDKGVHASAQVVSFESGELDLARVKRSVNKQLWPDIAVKSLIEVDAGFHARFSATGRAYLYRILNSPVHDPLRAARVWHIANELDVGLMNDAMSHLVGEHDFAALCRRYKDRSTVRTLEWARWNRSDDEISLSIGAEAFCHQMVRSTVALAVTIGSNDIDPDAVPDILASRDRSLTNGVAPAHALTLVAVAYGAPLPRPTWMQGVD